MKFKIQYVRSIETFAQSIEVMRKINMESLLDSIVVRFLFDRSKRALNRCSIPLNQSRLIKLNFLLNFEFHLENFRIWISLYQFYETIFSKLKHHYYNLSMYLLIYIYIYIYNTTARTPFLFFFREVKLSP